MSAVATKALDAFVAAIQAAYPTVSVKRRRNNAEVPLKGKGDSVPMIAVGIGDAESVEELFGNTVAVKYPVWVAYLTSAQVGDNTADDSPDVRDVRQTIRQLLHKFPITGLPELNDVFAGSRPAFASLSNDPSVNTSVMTFTVETLETRQSP